MKRSSYDIRVLRGGAMALMLFLSISFASANDDFEGAPEPSPTDAVKASGETFTAQGRAQAAQGSEPARFAALLDAYKNLVIAGLRRGVLAGGWGEMEGSYRIYGVDADHPNPQVMSWLTRSKVTGERTDKSDVVVEIRSPETGDLASSLPAYRAVVTQDVDRDGLSDVVGVGYDGSVYVSKATGSNGESTIVAKSPSYASFELVSGPGLERVRAVLPTAVGSIEPAGPGQARVVLELESMETVNGRLIGRGTEQREVLVSLSETEGNIRFTLEGAPDFTRLEEGQVELRGKALASRNLQSLEIRQNGELAWESPEGLNLAALQFNLARPLNGGWNLFRMTARDGQGAVQRRDLWLHGPASEPTPGTATKRAVVLALDDSWREKKLTGSLQQGGFAPDMVSLLSPDQASPAALLASIRDAHSAGDLLLYLEARVVPGGLIDGKSLKIGSGTLSSSDLNKAIDAGGYSRVLIVLHTEIDGSVEKKGANNGLWQDTARFLERLGDGGRLVLGNVESSTDSVRSQRSRSRDRFLLALDAPGGGDLARLVDLEQPENTVFRGWMFGTPVLGGASDAPMTPAKTR